MTMTVLMTSIDGGFVVNILLTSLDALAVLAVEALASRESLVCKILSGGAISKGVA